MTRTNPLHYEDDDRMLARVMREAMPKLRISPEFNKGLGMPSPDNGPAAKAERVAAFKREAAARVAASRKAAR